MKISFFEIATCCTIGLYCLGALAAFPGMAFDMRRMRRTGAWCALAAFVFQTGYLVSGAHASFGGDLPPGAYIQMLAWFVMLVSLIAWKKLGNNTLVLFSCPLALMLFLMSAATSGQTLRFSAEISPAFYALHMGSLFLGLGLVAIAGMAGIVFLVVRRRLKSRKTVTGFWHGAPPLSLLDQVNGICAVTAFPLFTLGLTTGFCFARTAFGTTVSGDPKEIAAMLVWLMLAVLFHNRLAKGWKGRKPAWLAIAIFAMSFLSFFLINFFLASHHTFIAS